MAAALGDLLQIVDKQTYYGQQVLNVFYYRVTSITGLLDTAYPELLTWFVDEVMYDIRQIQNGRLAHVELEIRNLSNGIDYAVLTHNLVGLESETSEVDTPSYVSLGFKLVRESLTTRNGYKRFAGLLDTRISGNTYTFATDTIKNNIQTNVAQDIVLGIATVAEPVIVRRPLIPPVGDEFVYASIGSCQYVGLGTQNTRKAGRGS